MIQRKGTNVYNKGKKIKTFEEEEDAELFANALSMMENNKTINKVVEQKTNKLFTSINEFKQYLLNENIDEKTYNLFINNKDAIFSAYLKSLNEMLKKRNFENIQLKIYDIYVDHIDLDLSISNVTDDVIFDVDKYPFLKDAELEFSSLEFDYDYIPGGGYIPNGMDGDHRDSLLHNIYIIDDVVEITLYIYDKRYQIDKEVKLSDYLDIEALNLLIYDKKSEKIRKYLDANYDSY